MTQNVIKAVRDTISKNDLIRKNGHVVVGLSGGPDSMCLFHALLTIKEDFGITISTVHLNHKFRPGAAEKDQDFVENLCNTYDIKCYSKTIDVIKLAAKRGETPEEAGRNERYKAFDEEALRVHSQGIPRESIAIAVAQNRNDQVETLLMRILRGTGTDGLSGIPYCRKSNEGFYIIRPVLDLDRDSIEKYCVDNKLEPRIDHTNKEVDYIRNKIRLDLIPKLMHDYNDKVEDAIIRLSKSANTDKEYFDSVVDTFLHANCKYKIDAKHRTIGASVNIKLINKVHNAVKVRIVTGILKDIGLKQGIESVHIEAAIGALEKEHTGKTVEFPQGYRMNISYDYARFYKDANITKTPSLSLQHAERKIKLNELNDNNEIVLPQGRLRIGVMDWPLDIKLDRTTVAFDYDSLSNAEDTLYLRYRQAGDRMFIEGMTGTKKLKDLLIDDKIPREKRRDIPILTSAEGIMWVMGIRKSPLFSCSNLTKRCLLLEWMPNN